MDIKKWSKTQKTLDHKQKTLNQKKAHATVALFLSHIAQNNYNNPGKSKFDRYVMMKGLREDFSWLFEEGDSDLSFHDARVK
jgi:hypothetical protein